MNLKAKKIIESRIYIELPIDYKLWYDDEETLITRLSNQPCKCRKYDDKNVVKHSACQSPMKLVRSMSMVLWRQVTTNPCQQQQEIQINLN